MVGQYDGIERALLKLARQAFRSGDVEDGKRLMRVLRGYRTP